MAKRDLLLVLAQEGPVDPSKVAADPVEPVAVAAAAVNANVTVVAAVLVAVGDRAPARVVVVVRRSAEPKI